MSAEPEAYFVERLREALAHDPRVAELGVSVRMAGGRVFLSGEVATPERKVAAAEVLGPLLEGRTLENGLTIATLTESDSEEPIA